MHHRARRRKEEKKHDDDDDGPKEGKRGRHIRFVLGGEKNGIHSWRSIQQKRKGKENSAEGRKEISVGIAEEGGKR